MTRKAHAARVVTEFALTRLQTCSLDEQVKVYTAIAEILPGAPARRARELAIALSAAAAKQLEFTEEFYKPTPGGE